MSCFQTCPFNILESITFFFLSDCMFLPSVVCGRGFGRARTANKQWRMCLHYYIYQLVKLMKQLKNVFFFWASPFHKRHFPCLAVFRPSRAFIGLFTTRLAKMADAQVRSGKRRGEFKSIFLHLNEHICQSLLSM